jgi:hypothetical protein
MEYSINTQLLQAKYNITINEIIFAHLVAAGLDPADAHYFIYSAGAGSGLTNQEQQTARAKELIRLNPGLSLLIQEIKRKQFKQTAAATAADLQQRELTEEEKEKYMTRKGLIEEIIKDLPLMPGKDRANVLQSLAKLQGLDKPDETEEEEKRIFVLRYLSHCRSCKLMKLYLQIQAEEKP